MRLTLGSLAFYAGVASVAAMHGGTRAADSSTVEKCSKKFGTITVADPRAGTGNLQRYGLGSPSALLRMMIQQSACFDVVERGVALQDMQQERALAQSGALRDNSNLGQGQMQVADFVMTPDVQIPASETGGAGGSLLSGLGKFGSLLGGLAGGVKFKEATTSLMVADVRSSIQVAAAEGKASKTDFSLGGWSIGPGMAGTAGGYTSSPEGQVIAASLLDNYNKIVVSIRDRPVLIQSSTPEALANAQGSTRAEAPIPAGQMLAPKIANVKLYAEPSRDSAVVATLQRGDELVASGEVKNGFARVDGANFSGWVQRTLVGPIGSGSTSQAAPAPAQAQAPAPAAVQVAIATPTYRYGAFAGELDGADKGSFRVLIDDEGVVNGDGNLTRLGAFGLNGSYDAAKGQLVMLGGSSGGQVFFIGRFDPSRGVIIGSWNLGGAGAYLGVGSAGGGSFSAQRRQ